jgi:hypothetical protein
MTGQGGRCLDAKLLDGRADQAIQRFELRDRERLMHAPQVQRHMAAPTPRHAPVVRSACCSSVLVVHRFALLGTGLKMAASASSGDGERFRPLPRRGCVAAAPESVV